MDVVNHARLRSYVERLEALTRVPGPWPAAQYAAVGTVIGDLVAFVGLRYLPNPPPFPRGPLLHPRDRARMARMSLGRASP